MSSRDGSARGPAHESMTWALCAPHVEVDMLALGVLDRRSGYPVETVVRAAAAGWRLSEVDVDYRPRLGVSKVTGTLRGSVHAVRDMAPALQL